MHAQYEHSPPTSSRSTTRDAQAALGQRAGAVLARRAGADDDDVVVALMSAAARRPLADHVLRVPVRPVCVALARALLVLAVRGCGAAQRLASSPAASYVARRRVTRPGSRAVISCSSQPLPSGSLNVANDA